ncbi:NAD-dependent protein deacetylase [Okibacterium endophyticum]
MTLVEPGAIASQLEAATEVLRRGRVAVLTGAGISTDSGIPDYRGAGAPVRTPMTIQQFLRSEAARKRYWAGSHLGWATFRSAAPNAGHKTLARFEEDGLINGVITQNVDGLHLRAGSRRVVDLHGSIDRILCLDCGQVFARESIAVSIERDNPWLTPSERVRPNPDGDADVDDVERFVLPICTVCGGRLKPDVVFFGEFVPPERFRAARDLVDLADALLIVGSSLAVNSGIRLLEQARRARKPIVIINRGETKGDTRATIKIDGGAAQTLSALAPRWHRN